MHMPPANDARRAPPLPRSPRRRSALLTRPPPPRSPARCSPLLRGGRRDLRRDDEEGRRDRQGRQAEGPRARRARSPRFGNDDPSRDPALLEVERGYDGGAPPRGRRSADARYNDGPRLERREVRGRNSASTHRAILRASRACAAPFPCPASPRPPRHRSPPLRSWRRRRTEAESDAAAPRTRSAPTDAASGRRRPTAPAAAAPAADAKGAAGMKRRAVGEVADVPPAAGEAVRAVGLVDARERRPRLAGRDAPLSEGHTRAPHTAAREMDDTPAPRAPRSRRTCSSSSRPT